jgi:hypothetical protein
MYTHVVLFFLKDPAQIPAAVHVLEGMAGRVPSLRWIQVGVDDQMGDRSAHIALVTRFDDAQGYAEYAVHPLHKQVLAHMKTVVDRSFKVDWSG